MNILKTLQHGADLWPVGLIFAVVDIPVHNSSLSCDSVSRAEKTSKLQLKAPLVVTRGKFRTPCFGHASETLQKAVSISYTNDTKSFKDLTDFESMKLC